MEKPNQPKNSDPSKYEGLPKKRIAPRTNSTPPLKLIPAIK